jgi:hypothetical protein
MVSRNSASRQPPRDLTAFEVIVADRVVSGVGPLRALDDAVLVGGQDLRAVRAAAAAANDSADAGDRPRRRVLVLIEAFLCETAREALTSAPFEAASNESGSVHYAGSPGGLASLVFDLFLLRTADGVVIVARGEHTARLLRSSALPRLAQRGVPVNASDKSHVA